MGKCVFSDLWLQKPLYKERFRKIKGDKHKARCIVCMKDVDGMHGRVGTHKSLERQKTSNTDITEKVITCPAGTLPTISS